MATVWAAVGTRAAAMIDLAWAFEPSSRAASATGPKAATPAAWQASTKPATSGASGPTTTRSIPAAAILAGSSAPSNGAASRSDPGVAGRAQHLGRLRGTQQRAHDRVLAPAAADHEDTRPRIREAILVSESAKRFAGQSAAMNSSIGIAINVS